MEKVDSVLERLIQRIEDDKPGFEDFAKLSREFYEAWRCEHLGTETRRRVLSNGVTTYHRQCLRCGSSRGAVKKASIGNPWGLKDFDETAAERWSQAYQDGHQRLLRRQDTAQQNKETKWWEWYNSYLESPEWARRREAVLQRADYCCEGCGLRRASQAHHLTYKRAGQEMLFDLVAICTVCHQKLHEATGAPA